MTIYQVQVPDRMFMELPSSGFDKLKDWGNTLAPDAEVYYWQSTTSMVHCFKTECSDLATLLTTWVEHGWQGVEKFVKMRGIDDE